MQARPGSVFPFGTTTVHCSAVDSVGNTASGSFTVTVTASDLEHVAIDFKGELGPPSIHWAASRHVPRLMSGSLTATRGVASIRFGMTVAPFGRSPARRQAPSSE